jgi:plastocyanin
MKRFTIGLLIAGVTFGVAFAAEHSIVQKDLTFAQSTITIPVGDEVLWGNIDNVTHNIHIKGGGEDIDLGLQKFGQVLKHTFDKPGPYVIMCTIHPRMKMVVTVQ